MNSITSRKSLPSPKHIGREQDWGGRTVSVLLRYRVCEFLVAIVMLLVAYFVHEAKVFIRPIPSVDVRISPQKTVHALDPSINQEKKVQQVPMWLLFLLSYILPIVVHFGLRVVDKIKKNTIQFDTRDFLLSIFISAAFSLLLTSFIKVMTGRFRPCFYQLCGWDFAAEWNGKDNLCTLKQEMDGRKSFPSGHSSAAFSGLYLLTLYLLGRSKLCVINRSYCPVRGSRKMFKLFICFIPTLVAAWIAITRSIDNYHHYSDILAGSIIGLSAATLSYGHNYGSIYSWKMAGFPLEHYYNKRKLQKEDERKYLGSCSDSEDSSVSFSEHCTPQNEPAV